MGEPGGHHKVRQQEALRNQLRPEQPHHEEGADHTHDKIVNGVKVGEARHDQAPPHKPGTHFELNLKTFRWEAHEVHQHAAEPIIAVVRHFIRLISPQERKGQPTAGTPLPREMIRLSKKEVSGIGKEQGIEKRPAEEKKATLPEILQRVGQAIQQGTVKGITLFETILIRWVGRWAESERGDAAPQECRLPKGEARFAEKGEKGWVDFLKKALPFTFLKVVNREEVSSMRIRGLVQEPPPYPERAGKEARGARSSGASLIADLQLKGGKGEKFAQIPLQNNVSPERVGSFLAQLATLRPGTTLSQALLSQWFTTPELTYLAMSYKIMRPDLLKGIENPMTESAQGRASEGIVYNQEPTRGIALSARTEQMIARELDLRLTTPAVPKTGGDSPAEGVGKTSEGLSAIWGFFSRGGRRRRSSEEEAILVPGFVPWYQLVFQSRKWKGRVRWYIPLLYFSVASAVALSLVYLFKFLLQR